MVAAVASAQTITGTGAKVNGKAIIGGTVDAVGALPEPLRIVGVRDIVNGATTIRPTVIDNDGDVLKDGNTSITTAGVWTFGAGLAAGTSINGSLISKGTSSVSIASLGFDNLRIGVNAGTPRVIWEDTAGSWQWTADVSGSVYRLYRTDATGTADRVPLFLNDLINVNPAGRAIVPVNSYETSLGSPLKKFLGIYGAELNVETLVAQSVMATIGGRIIVAPTTYLRSDLSDSATTIVVQQNNLASGDVVYMEGDGRVEFMSVGSSATLINRCAATGNGCSADATTNWNSNTGTVTQTLANRYQGNAAVQVSAATNGDVYHTGAGLTSNNTQYTISIYIKRADGAAIVPSSSAYQMYCRDSFGPGAVNADGADDVGNGWYRLHVTCTTGTTGNDVAGVLKLPNVIHYVDAMQVELGASMTPWTLTGSSYTVTRNLDSTGANFWEAGSALVNTGQTGNGLIDLYSTRGFNSGTEIGPTIVGKVRTSSTYNALATRWGIGNLNGLCDYSTNIYGFLAGDCSAGNLTADATYGLRIRNGTTDKLVANSSGLTLAEGGMTLDSNGIRIVGYAGANPIVSRSYGFDFGDSLVNGVSVWGSTVRQLGIRAAKDGATSIELIAENISGDDATIDLASQNGGTGARVVIGASDLYLSPTNAIFINGNSTFTGTKTAGSCSIQVEKGLVKNISGC